MSAQLDREDIWDYLETLSNLEENTPWLPVEIPARLLHLRKRFDFYSDEKNKSFKKISAWKKQNQLARNAKKLKAALLALKELESHTAKIDMSEYHQMHKATLDVINIQLLKLEIAQLYMLSKAQNLAREYENTTQESVYIPLAKMEEKLQQLRTKFNDDIENIKHRYSSKAKKYQLKNAVTFFHFHERKIHFTKHFKRADKTSDSIAAVSAFNHLLGNIAKASTDLLNALSPVTSVLNAIPFINAAVSGITVLVLAAKMWWRNKGITKKTFAASLVLIVVGGIITMGLGTAAAAGVAVGLMLLGTVVKHIQPWIRMLSETRKKQNELNEIDATQKDLTLGELKIFGLREKQFLMVAIEQAWLKGSLNNPSILNEIKKLINEGDFKTLTENQSIKEYILKDTHLDLEDFIDKQMNIRRSNLKHEIDVLKEQEKSKRRYVVNGTLAVIGAILLCIPTPPTLIIGASILFTTAIVGACLNFQVGTKITNASKRWFPAKSEKVYPEAENKITFNHGLEKVMSLKNAETEEPEAKVKPKGATPAIISEPEQAQNEDTESEGERKATEKGFHH